MRFRPEPERRDDLMLQGEQRIAVAFHSAFRDFRTLHGGCEGVLQ